MNPSPVSFPARARRDILLAGELLDGGGRSCVVSHPHPLAGGDMDHAVVVALWRAAARAGLRALRYNFRGVGASTGALTSKSPLASDDLLGAIDFLGGGPALAIGYSYGARVTLHALRAGGPIARAALVALPTRLPANRAAMSNLILGRPVRTEEFSDSPDVDLLLSPTGPSGPIARKAGDGPSGPIARAAGDGPPTPLRIFAGSVDPLVRAADLRARGVEPVLFEGCNHFFSRRLGNQRPLDADLDALATAVLSFLLE